MKRRVVLLSALVVTAFVVIPTSAVADPNNEAHSFNLVLPSNRAEAPNGDRVAVSGSGTFSVHPKSVTASGTFTHTDSNGNVVGSGTWVATDLRSFEFYGCGVIESVGATVPPNFCGGALKLAITLTPTGTTLQLKGMLTVFCIIGAQAPSSHDDPPEEGINLVVPGIANFNQIVPPNMNVFIKTS